MNGQVFLGIDFGERRIGLAKSDPSGLIASAHRTITYKVLNKAIDEIVEEAEKLKVAGIVVGYPVAPDEGSGGERCRMVDGFIEKLKKKYDGPIYRMDERDSTEEAKEIMHRYGKKTGKEREKLDRLAAAVILQRYLDER